MVLRSLYPVTSAGTGTCAITQRGAPMSWQAGIRHVGAGIMVALLAAGCSAPQRTTLAAPPGTGTVAGTSVHAAQTHAAGSGTPAAQPALGHTPRPAHAPTHRAGAHTAGGNPPGTNPVQSQFRPRL